MTGLVRPAGRLAAGAALAGIGCFGYGVLVESKAFRLRRYTVPVLPSGADPVKVLHLSDLHLYPGQDAKERFVRSLAELHPDLVVNTGDNHAHADVWPRVLRTYGPLLDVPGVFVWGSNDYVAPKMRNPLAYFGGPSSRKKAATPPTPLPWQKLQEAFTSAGWVELTHRRATVEVAGLNFAFRGTDDAHMGRDRYDSVAGPADPDAVLNIGVTHAPYLRLLDAMTSDRMDLIFAGHTHGGQVCVPGYGALVTNCDIDRHRVKGLSRHTVAHAAPAAGDTDSGDGHTAALHVSGGLGMSPFAPYRFACPPEATLLTLVARDSE